MGYEVDYIPVGEGEKSGDAITLRFGNLSGSRSEQVVVVIDGGFKESGESLVGHINDYYKTKDVNYVIATHPDADHASGLSVVLEKMNVGALLMHKPWEHASDIKSLFKDGRITGSGLEDRLEKSLQHARDLEALANRKNIPIYEPFQGVKNNVIHVLGPSQNYYESMLPHFSGTPEPKRGLGILGPLRKAAEEEVNWIEDNLHIDLLNDDEDTASPENNTSAIILFNLDGHKLLFTGDAGKTALLHAIEYSNNVGIPLTDLSFLDVPHHGSKHNLSSRVLQHIKPATAFVSASKGSTKHPAKKVTNALKKRGAVVYVNNRGTTLCHHHEGLNRGWVAAMAEPFYSRIEE